ncbi:MAG: hypothetical protein IJ344_05775 [Clostridia bacterium]|nr:hypothetical protein [Clostridia bacterium]
MKRIVCVLLCVFLTLPCFSLGISAQTALPSDKELIELGKDAECMAYLLLGSFYGAAMALPDKTSDWRDQRRVKEFLLEKGYAENKKLTPVTLTTASNEALECYPLSGITDTQALEEEVLKYFTPNFLALIDTEGEAPLFLEHDGTLYGRENNFIAGFTAEWEAFYTENGYHDLPCKITKRTPYHAEAEFFAFMSETGGDGFMATMEFYNTEQGWRVCGGSFFDLICKKEIPLYDSPLTQLCTLGKDAEIFARLLNGVTVQEAFSSLSSKYSLCTNTFSKDSYEFLLKTGYADNSAGDTVMLAVNESTPAERIKHFPFAPHLNSIEALKKEYFTYFTDDFVNIFEKGALKEHDNKLYVYDTNTSSFGAALWEKAQLLSYDGHTALITVPLVEGTGHALNREFLGYGTVEFENTADGWRVCGGSYFDYEYLNQDVLTPEAPKAGDDTGFYLAVCALFLGVGVLAVTTMRKRKGTI